MSTRVLREKVKAQEAELIGLYQENAKLKVLVATDYHKLSNGERDSLIDTLEKMQGPRMKVGNAFNFKSIQEINKISNGEVLS